MNHQVNANELPEFPLALAATLKSSLKFNGSMKINGAWDDSTTDSASVEGLHSVTGVASKGLELVDFCWIRCLLLDAPLSKLPDFLNCLVLLLARGLVKQVVE